MDTDKKEDSTEQENSSKRIYKSAISGILSNKSKYGSWMIDSCIYRIQKPYVCEFKQGRKLGLISRVIGKSNEPLVKRERDTIYSRWKHDKYDSLLSHKPGSMIFVRNLPNDVTPEYLKLYFNSSGTVCSIKINKGALTSATVGFVEEESAQKAVDSFHKQELNGRTIKVSISNTGKYKSNKSTSATGRVSIFDRMG
ncbi:uncharacterized protein TOT_040000382 [Theileria orientalis strain Shintoku]|uniref:RRM domain-containing protein n=1 Tax=Theileria orientalis strain Shintoku TaxID=869250 RepID=J4C966_THEOR|nr:uncharacterized protein TOT_040000382 [Theileria orientalis strain Shintoku]BAM42003.1 uncharacterized protein TOT_040000382 [Theileria orientalis strain Shintoku]|eukprot:XP_009692304.1 uncharacterized protein TOT_040000382 [Theileria orientalis strain Shintoku]